MAEGINWLKHHGYKVSALGAGQKAEGGAAELIECIKGLGISILIIDSYALPSGYFKPLSREGALLAVIDDNELHAYDCDILINCNIGAENRGYLGTRAGLKLLGGKYCILRKEFAEAPPVALHEKVSDILVTMGGSDPNNCTPLVVRGLAPIGGITMHIVYGPLMGNMDEIRLALDESGGEAAIYEQPGSMPSIMGRCGMAVSAGGGTMRELFALGLPSLFICQAENQRPVCEYLSKTGYPLYIGNHDSLRPGEITGGALQMIGDFDLRKNIQQFMLGTVDPKGASNIVSEINAFMPFYRQKRDGCKYG